MQFEDTRKIGLIEYKLQSDENSETDNFIYKSTLVNHCESLTDELIREIILQFDIELGADVSEVQWTKQVKKQLQSIAIITANEQLSKSSIEVRND